MIFALSLAAVGIAGGAIVTAARQARQHAAPVYARRGLGEPGGFEIVGGRWDWLRVDAAPIGDDEALRLTLSYDGDAVVSARASREETALALATIARCIAEGIEDEEARQ